MIKSILKPYYRKLKRLKYKKNNTLDDTCVIGKNVSLTNCVFDKHSRVAEYASIKDTKIGAYSTLGRYSKIVHTEIGKYCAISWDITINAISHPYNNLTISAFPYVPRLGNFVKVKNQSYKEVIIKNDVWIGANSVVMPGVVIGNGVVIGAGAVVTKDIPDYAIVVGVPAKVVKYRFEKNVIERLLEIEWWNFDDKTIKGNIILFQGELNEEKLKKIESLRDQNKGDK